MASEHKTVCKTTLPCLSILKDKGRVRTSYAHTGRVKFYIAKSYYPAMPKKKIPQDRLMQLVPKMRVKYRDIFSLKDFYIFMHEYLLEHEWIDQEGDLDHWESYYFERLHPGDVREIYLHWRVKKVAPDTPMLEKDGKPIPAFTYYLDFNWHCIGLTKIEAVKEGHKLTLDRGEIEIEMFTNIEEGYKEAIKDLSPLIRPFKRLFASRVYEEQIEYRRKEFYQEVYALHNAIKQWFKMKRYLPYEDVKSFHPPKAWPSM